MFYPILLTHWVGEAFVSTVGPLLMVLVSAHCLRNIAAPYSLMLLATGLHRRALISAVVEGISNLAASIVLGMKWGAIGVACGTLVGSVVGVAATLAMNASRTPELTPYPIRFSMYAVVLPLVFFAPIHYAVLQSVM